MLGNISKNIPENFYNEHGPNFTISSFNNHYKTTVEDVIDLFERSKV